METIIAKYLCTSVTKSKHWDGRGRFLFTAKMSPVMSGSEENKKFFEATPSGSFEIGMFKDDAFEPGKEYFLNITKAEPAQ